jgi:hypothetical protein
VSNLLGDKPKGFGGASVGGSDSYNLTTSFGKFDGLTSGCFNIEGVGGGHRLNSNGLLPPYYQGTDVHFTSGPALRLDAGVAVRRRHDQLTL